MSNYGVGYSVERDLIEKARAKGLIAFGSRGSHSPIDVVVIEKDGTPHFYQLKSTKKPKITPSDYEKELQKFKKIKVKGVKHFWIKYRGKRYIGRGGGKKEDKPRWLFQWNSE